MENDHLNGLFNEIQHFKDKIDVVADEQSRLYMIQFHNKKVDQFCIKFDESEAKLDKFLPNLKEIKSKPSDPLAEQFKNIDVMEESEAFELVEKLN